MLAAKPLPDSKPKSTRGPTVTKLAQRLSKIPALLHQGDEIDKRWLAEKYKVSVRTIERDLADRLHGIVEHTADGRWQLVPHQRSTIPARHLHDYTHMAGTAQLFPDRSLPYLLEQLDTPEPRRATRVQPIPHEDLRTQSPAFAQLQAAIERHHECRFTYKGTLRQFLQHLIDAHNDQVKSKMKCFQLGTVTAALGNLVVQFGDADQYGVGEDYGKVWDILDKLVLKLPG